MTSPVYYIIQDSKCCSLLSNIVNQIFIWIDYNDDDELFDYQIDYDYSNLPISITTTVNYTFNNYKLFSMIIQ